MHEEFDIFIWSDTEEVRIIMWAEMLPIYTLKVFQSVCIDIYPGFVDFKDLKTIRNEEISFLSMYLNDNYTI